MISHTFLLGLDYEKFGKAYRIEVADTVKATELVLAHPEIFKARCE